jgi:phosphohistidine swiveling domain-containing protein
MPATIPYSDPGAATQDTVGGKAANLARLRQAGLMPPPWFCVTVEVFRNHLNHNGLRPTIRAEFDRADLSNLEQAAEVGRAVRGLVASAPLPPEDEAEIRAAYARAFPDEPFTAVRSSALGEDSVRHSFAGQMDSYLFIKGADAVVDAVRRCFASGFSDRAIAYRHANGIDPASAEVAVIVQAMVDAEVSGVLFTANPVSNDRAEMLVNATWGLGEGVVQGTFDTDTFRIPRSDGAEPIVETRDKSKMYVFDRSAGSGSIVVEVDAPRRSARCLSDEHLRELEQLGRRAEDHFGRPQDIEFSIRDGELYVLQTRPITTLPAGPEDGNRIIWDNSNIIESYAGVTLPLTYSFILQAYTNVFSQFTEVMGVPAAVRKANQQTFANMLGLIDGRVYYNLRNWYKMMSLLPGFKWNKGFWELMMGIKERWPEEVGSESPTVVQRYLVDLPRLGLTVGKTLFNFVTVNSKMRRFLANMDQTLGPYQDFDFDSLRPDELMRIYQMLEQKILGAWKAPIITDFYSLVFYGVLKKLIVNWKIDESGSLQNDLLCGEGGIASTEPPAFLLRLARQIAADEQARAYFLEHGEPELVRWARSDEAPLFVREGIERYLRLYGDRSMNELKLEVPTLRENPSFIFTMLRNYLRAGTIPNPDELHEKELAVRRAAERRVAEALGGSPARSALFNWVLNNARMNVKNRENQRFARTQVYSLVRTLFCAIARDFEAEGILRDADDIFYLEVHEIFDYIKGTATCTDLQGLVDLRRRSYEQYQGAEPDPRITTYGMVYLRNPFFSPKRRSADLPEGYLQGIGCCPGVVQGPVRKILSPDDDMSLNGEILVAEKTDPGWIPLYPSASGILIERGSMLSHSAIVAREMGKPTIVGIDGLIAEVEEGQVVEMDGATGLVKLHP